MNILEPRLDWTDASPNSSRPGDTYVARVGRIVVFLSKSLYGPGWYCWSDSVSMERAAIGETGTAEEAMCRVETRLYYHMTQLRLDLGIVISRLEKAL